MSQVKVQGHSGKTKAFSTMHTHYEASPRHVRMKSRRELDSTRWFSHRCRTGGRHDCITYLLTDVVACPTARPATPTSVCWFFA